MSEVCWRVRKLATQPQVSATTVQKRDARRAKHDGQELLVVQCLSCKLILHRSFLPPLGLRHENKEVNLPINALGRISIRTVKGQVHIFCMKCNFRIGSITESKTIKMDPSAVTMQVPEGKLFQTSPYSYKREPFDLLGAFSGLSFRNTMNEIYRLAYTKMLRYKLLMRVLSQSFKRQEKKFKGLYNLILLNENSKGRSSKSEPKMEYDRMMRSTTVQHSHSYQASQSLGRPRDSALPH